MFRKVPLSIIRSFSLYTWQWFMSYRFADSFRTGSEWVPSWPRSQAVSKSVWHIRLLCVQWKPPDDGQRNCPKHVEFYSKNKFEKLVNLVGFMVRNLTRWKVTWTSNSRLHISALNMRHYLAIYKLWYRKNILHNPSYVVYNFSYVKVSKRPNYVSQLEPKPVAVYKLIETVLCCRLNTHTCDLLTPPKMCRLKKY
jgi:hypothetical protein